jgi:hypothetical protein
MCGDRKKVVVVVKVKAGEESYDMGVSRTAARATTESHRNRWKWLRVS